MKTLFVYRYLTHGGVEAVLSTRLRLLPARGFEAHAWFLHDYGGRDLFTGVEDRLHTGDPSQLEAFLRREEPPVVTIIDTPEVFPVLRSCKGCDRRVVLEVHTTYPEHLEYLDRLGGLPVAAFVAPSKTQAFEVRKLVSAPAPVVVLPNPLAPEFCGTAPSEVPSSPRPVLLFIGRLDDHKDWQSFLAIGKLVAEQEPSVELWIVGAPVDASGAIEFERQVRRSGVLKRLRWLIRLPPSGIRATLDATAASGGALLATSRAESFGMTIAEAMARRCPVIVPDTGPFYEYVQHRQTGILYRPGSRVDAAEHALELLRDPDLHCRLGSEGSRTVLARHGAEVAMDAFEEFLQSVVELSGPDSSLLPTMSAAPQVHSSTSSGPPSGASYLCES
jgi:glycosyltransferase involved in cell wall biosynthesis